MSRIATASCLFTVVSVQFGVVPNWLFNEDLVTVVFVFVGLSRSSSMMHRLAKEVLASADLVYK